MNITKLDDKAVLYNDTAEVCIQDMATESIDLTVTSPPYNIGKEYEKKKSLDDYIADQYGLVKALMRVTKSSGSVCWQVGNFVSRGEVVPLDILYYSLFKSAGFKLRNRIIWTFGHGLHASKRFSGRYETILWFTKSDSYTFNLDNVRVPSKYPNKKHFKGPKKGELSGNPRGKNPSDIWTILEQDWEKEIWEIPNVKSNHREKTNHPCQYPIELVQRCVLALTNEGDTVFDPFTGSGTTLLASSLLDRKSIGCELSPEYVDLVKSRFKLFSNIAASDLQSPSTKAVDESLTDIVILLIVQNSMIVP